MKRRERCTIKLQLFGAALEFFPCCGLVLHGADALDEDTQVEALVLIGCVLLQHGRRHRARQQTRKINTAEKLFFIALLGKKPLKLPRTGDVPTEQVDGIALGLSRLTQNKQVFSRQQGNGDHLHQFLPLGHAIIGIRNDRQHLISQRHFRASLRRQRLFIEAAVLRERIDGNDMALSERVRCAGHTAEPVGRFAAKKLILELGENVLLQASLFRVIARYSLDKPQGKLLVHIVIFQPSRSHERAILTDHTVDAPKIRFHNGVALSD